MKKSPQTSPEIHFYRNNSRRHLSNWNQPDRFPRELSKPAHTALRQGIPRKRFSHFDYPSDSDSEPAITEPPIPDPAPQVLFPELDDLAPLFSDQEVQPEMLTESLIPSPSGTSAPFLSNPSLTDTLSNIPLFPPSQSRPLAQAEQPQRTNTE